MFHESVVVAHDADTGYEVEIYLRDCPVETMTQQSVDSWQVQFRSGQKMKVTDAVHTAIQKGIIVNWQLQDMQAESLRREVNGLSNTVYHLQGN